MAITDLEIRMTIKTLAAKGLPKRAITRQLDLSEGTVRYHLARQAANARDGRANQPRRAEAVAEAIGHWMAHHDRANLAALHAWLAAEHGYQGSLRSVQRFVADRYPPPRKRARRRFETPPGAQAQVDWAQFPRMIVGGQSQTLHAFHLVLSHSRFGAVVWMPAQDSLCWLAAHNGAFERIAGIPAVLRVDNTKTAVVHGAGAWGRLNESYRRYATTVRFHVDPCTPYSPEHKGKVERAVRTHRGVDLARQAWDSVEQLQVATDEALHEAAHRRCCPATGTSVFEGWQASARPWHRCRACRHRSTMSPPGKSGATGWWPSRAASTRCRSPGLGAWSRCAAGPAPCRCWPTTRSWPNTRATPTAGC